MTLEDLRVFVAAYQASSFSEAARRIGRTQGAVTQHVRRLESELEVELFTRLRRGISATEEGRILYEAASPALASLDSGIEALRLTASSRMERLRLAVGANLISALRRATHTLKERRPEVEIEVIAENTTEGRLSVLREGRADLALIPLSCAVQSLEVRPHSEVELGLLVRRDHPLAKQKELALEDLATIRYIAQSTTSATYQHIAKVLIAHGISLQPIEVAEVPAIANMLVEVNAGETFVPRRLASKLEKNGTLKVLPVPALAPLRMGWCARSFAMLPKAAVEFIDICDQLLHRQPPTRGA